jgi:beta-glucosidase
MSAGVTRRDVAGLAAAAAVSSASPAAAQPADEAHAARLGFPDGFRWGVATSAYQIEGAVNEDGRGPSIWDTYTHTPGKIRNNATGDVANDHYHRYKDDIALMRGLGAGAYRFSIAWPRIFPSGTGQPNPKGLDFYSRLVDALLAAGIAPFPTLYHWDLPQALQDKHAGWQSRDTAQAFADYAATMARALGDRVAHWFTLNELYSFVDLGHTGVFAPGLKLAPGPLNQVRHNAVLAHGLSVRAIRANAKLAAKIGPADNISIAVPVIETPAHIRAAEIATREMNAPFLTVMLEGEYTAAYLTAAGKDAPRFSNDDLAVIATPIDFVGINVYRPAAYVEASGEPSGYKAIPFNTSHPRMLSAWELLAPEAMYWGPRLVQALWKPQEIYITENGCGASDAIAEDGRVYDSDRIMYVRNHLMHLQRATHEGIPVKGYFHWSLMDNFEWNDGYETRFGLVHVDFTTQKRTPKASAAYFGEAARRNAVV